MKALGLAFLLLASVARAQFSAGPFSTAGGPTFNGTVTFLTDPQVQGSLNAGDIVCNGVGTNAGICHGGSNDGGNCVISAQCTGGGICGFTGFRVQADRPQSVSGTPVPPAVVGRQFISGWSFDSANHSTVVEFVGDGVSSSKEYVFVNGHLGTGASFGTPLLTSTGTPAFGLEGTDANGAIVMAAAGSNQTVLRPITFTTVFTTLGTGAIPAGFASASEPLPTCSATNRGAIYYDTSATAAMGSQAQYCQCTLVGATNRWCTLTAPGCTNVGSTATACANS